MLYYGFAFFVQFEDLSINSICLILQMQQMANPFAPLSGGQNAGRYLYMLYIMYIYSIYFLHFKCLLFAMNILGNIFVWFYFDTCLNLGTNPVSENPQRGAENTSPLPNPWGSSTATTTASSTSSSTASTSATSTTSGPTPSLFRLVVLT